MRKYRLGTILDLEWTAEPAALAGTVVLWLLLSGLGTWWLELPAGQAVFGGLIATLLYWLSYIVHQLGHAVAARQTGHPMAGVHLGTYLVLGTSVYPADEGTLPAAVHIRRALGGPVGSLLLTLVTGAIALLLRRAGGVAWYVALFVSLNNLITLTLGSFLPLGFTDGSTLLTWWGKR